MSLLKEIDIDVISIIEEISENIFYKTSSRMLAKGRRVFNGNKNPIINIHKKNISIDIDLKINSENSIQRYPVSIGIDRKFKDIYRCECGCIDYKNNSHKNKNYMCKHIIAGLYIFFDSLRKDNVFEEKINTQKQFLEIFQENNIEGIQRLDLDIFIKLDSIMNSSYFEIFFKVGHEKKYNIKDIKKFYEARNSGEDYEFSKLLIYSRKDSVFEYEDERIIENIGTIVLSLEMLREAYGIRGIRNIGCKGNTLRMPLKMLSKFCEIINHKKITFILEDIQYENISIIKENLPIEILLSKNDDRLELKTNKFISLSEMNDVFFYKNNLYIPKYEQLKYFSKMQKILQREESILIEKENFNEFFEKIYFKLKEIGRFSLDDSIKNVLEEGELKAEFYLDIKRKNISIDVKKLYGDTDSNNTEKIIIRDKSKEIEIEKLLNSFNFINNGTNYEFLGDDDNLFDFLEHGLKELKRFGEVFYSESFKKYKVISSSSTKTKIKEEINYFEITFETKDFNLKDIEKIIEAIGTNKKYFRVSQESFLDLQDTELINFLSLVSNVNSIGNSTSENLVRVSKNRAFYLKDFIEKRKIKDIRGVKYLEAIVDNFNSFKKTNFELPNNLNANLRDYQKDGFNWFKTLEHFGFAGILADEMGLGKTIQTIAYILSNKGKSILVVTPTSLLYNWSNEFEKFASDLKIGIIHGDKKNREKVLGDLSTYDVILTTYGTLKNDLDIYSNKMFDVMIIDEAQSIKNDSSKVAHSIKLINAKYKFALTGTPIENNLLELWSIFDFIMPGYLYSKQKFSKRFSTSDNFLELTKMIEPFILRREKKDVIKELPDKFEKKFFVELSKMQKTSYLAYTKKLKKELKNEASKNKIEILSYLTKLRQLCLDPNLVIDNYKGGNSKLEVTMDILDEYIKNNHKVLIFSQFTSVLKVIEEELKLKDIEFSYIDGSINAKERLRLVDEFNESFEKKVFLISLKAGGTGLNLTSADVVIHYDPWWNPAVQNQATDRAHRIGQINSVEVINLIAKGTIEEKILKLQENKNDIIKKVMTGNLSNSSILSSLSEKQLIELFDSEF
ncbi:MAG: DEAD/DEAH box helicase [Sarcina sp.]